MCFIHVVKYYLAFQSKEILSHNFEDIMLNEVSQSQKWFRLYEVSKVITFMESESRTMFARGWGEGEIGSCCSVGIEFQRCKMKSSRNLLHNNLNILDISELNT